MSSPKKPVANPTVERVTPADVLASSDGSKGNAQKLESFYS